MSKPSNAVASRSRWRDAILAAVILAVPGALFRKPAFDQDPAYHAFADQRMFAGVPNFLDVASNLPFLLIGLAGVVVCCKRAVGASRAAWMTMFLGVAAVGVGSAYYHWQPTDQALVWDRLPITLGFMGLFAALLGEYVSQRMGRVVLVPSIVLGVVSVLLWLWAGDLRLYFSVQFAPLLAMPVILLLYKPAWSHRWLLVAALGLYVLAKIAEANDEALFRGLGQLLSGHTAKHLLAGLSCLALVVMVAVRRPLHASESSTHPVPGVAQADRGVR